MSSSAGSSLAPQPDVALGALYDGTALRRRRRSAAWLTGILTLAVALPVIGLFGHARAEWALAFGRARVISAVVVGSGPSAEPSRTCSMTQIDVAWPAAAGTSTGVGSSPGIGTGEFTVCNDDASRFPAGQVVKVAVLAGDSSVIYGESRADAIFGVVLESLIGLFVLCLLAGAARWLLVLAVAAKRWKKVPWLPGEARPGGGVPASRRRGSRGVPVVVFLDSGSVPWPPGSGGRFTCLSQAMPSWMARLAEESGLDRAAAIDVVIQHRKDGAQLEPGDRVWVAPAGRTLLHRRSSPYAVIRGRDRRVFWAMGRTMPGSGW